MPIYEYECSLCQCHFDKKQKFNEEPVAICPECQGKAFRVFHSVPIIFNGSGFYITDSRKAKAGATEKAEERTPGKSKQKRSSGEGATPASH